MRRTWERKRVRTGIIAASALWLFHSPVLADNIVRFKWLANTGSVDGYNVYYGTGTRAYDYFLEVGNRTNVTVSNLIAGTTYYFAITAFNATGESDFSNELRYTVPTNAPPPIPSFVGITVTTGRQTRVTVTGATNRSYAIETTTNLYAWSNVGAVTIGPSGSAAFTDTNAPTQRKRFYRARAL